MSCRSKTREEALAWLEERGLPCRYWSGKYRGCGLLTVARMEGPGISYAKDFMARTPGFFDCLNDGRGEGRRSVDLLKALYALRLVRRVKGRDGSMRWARDVLREHYHHHPQRGGAPHVTP